MASPIVDGHAGKSFRISIKYYDLILRTPLMNIGNFFFKYRSYTPIPLAVVIIYNANTQISYYFGLYAYFW
ncbi:MAG: hypothetical protein CM1200mP10_05460 [Candidatus Neomarinimicrobiota bacterium]|nr:MAG: hypothetical protein CM1200mP10_05460 [Candidatus Neomarinimicrobiota bacterium]